MSEGVPAASKGAASNLVELERELDALLLEYESLSRAWPKEPDILTRAKIGRRVEDALRRICELQHAIATAQAKTLPTGDCAGVRFEAHSRPTLGLAFTSGDDPKLTFVGANSRFQSGRAANLTLMTRSGHSLL